jgi:hypothetical protein
MAVLGLMAVSASGAQAIEGWLVNKETLTKKVTGEAVIHPLKNGTVHGVLLVPAKELEILCKKLKTSEGLLETVVLVLGILEFTECETFQKKVLNKNCKPKEPITATVLAHLFLHNALTYVLLEPDGANGEPGKKFTLIDFNEETCALPDSEVKGEAVAECLDEELKTMEEATGKPDLCLVDLVNHLIQEAPSRSLFGITEAKELKYGANPAFIDGILKAFLTGEHKGMTWSGHI